MKFFNKTKEFTIYSPLEGKVVSLEDTKDKVFTSHVIGDGVAIEPTGDGIFAPVSSKVEIFKTNHLLIFEPSKGTYVVIHFGIDTSKLEGKGFTRILDEKKAEKGDKIIGLDLDYLRENATALTTPVIVCEELVKNIEVIPPYDSKVNVGDPLIKVTLK